MRPLGWPDESGHHEPCAQGAQGAQRALTLAAAMGRRSTRRRADAPKEFARPGAGGIQSGIVALVRGSLVRSTSAISCPQSVAPRGYSSMQPEVNILSSETNRLLKRAAAGDGAEWGRLLEQHRARLRRMVALRLDPRVQGRIDASDVIQETYVEASARRDEYLRNPAMPFFLWLRFLAGQKLVTLHRRHLGTRMRGAGREVALYRGQLPATTSAALAAQLLGHQSRPSAAAIRAEVKIRLQEALNSMDAIDREVLALRHFEQLSRAEAAAVLGIQESACSKRYVRALKRLKEILSNLPGGLGELSP
jgi:RNA polymerase sigma-70 factor, ECF subfamily